MLVGSADSVQMHNAPNFIREALTFPYRYGLDFEVALLTKAGKGKAYQDTFKNPPTSTRQIMEPETYLSGEHIPPMPVPNFKQIFKNYSRFDIGSIGEFDVAMLIDQYAGVENSRKLYPHWRGGYYYAAKPKADPSASLGLFYISRWSDLQHAASSPVFMRNHCGHVISTLRPTTKKRSDVVRLDPRWSPQLADRRGTSRHRGQRCDRADDRKAGCDYNRRTREGGASRDGQLSPSHTSV